MADAYGSGTVEGAEHGTRELVADEWLEVDVRDVVRAGDVGAVVRYRDDGREVILGPGDEHQAEYDNPDVIDVRGAAEAADEIWAAIDGLGTDEQRIFRALERIPTDRNREPWIEQLRALYADRAGQSLDDALEGDLCGDDLRRAQDLLR